jgi:GNAT superfamily N-acetyltransferase
MWPRLIRAEFVRSTGERNKRALKRIVMAGNTPGILAYRGREPIGWCAVAPRKTYARIERSRTLKPVDDRPVWSVVCFFIARRFRRKGLTVRLLGEAIRFAAGRGATVIEGYPVEPRSGKTADAFAWTGLAAAFTKAGFVEVARPSATRPIMRFEVGRGRTRGGGSLRKAGRKGSLVATSRIKRGRAG